MRGTEDTGAGPQRRAKASAGMGRSGQTAPWAMALYSAALGAGLVLGMPWWIVHMVKTARYREGLSERLGRVPARVRAVVRGQRVVWLHAVSVGEVLAVARLVGELGPVLEAAGGGRWVVVVSTTTRTGQAVARERFGAERVFYLPLDFRWAVRSWMRALRPELVVLAESEVWPRLLAECGRGGVPVAVVNARVSDRSFRRAMPVRRVWGRVLRGVTRWLAQSEEDARRLVALGVRDGAVEVSGNLKYDVRTPGESRVAAMVREVSENRPVIVAGSTTDDKDGACEESVVLHAWEGAARQQYGALLVLAPRHPERFGLVESLITEFAYAKASDWLGADKSAPVLPKQNEDEAAANEYGLRPWQGPSNFLPGHKRRLEVVLLDTMGDLAAVYRVADVAFVGGSLVRRGGHNPLEPARFGVPVVTGPSYENFRDVVESLKTAGAIRIVSGSRNRSEELGDIMAEMLRDREGARAMGERGRRVFADKGGATERTARALVALAKRDATTGLARESGRDGGRSA